MFELALWKGPAAAAERFADSLESVAIILAENAGIDPIDAQAQLRAKAGSERGKKPRYSVDVINGKVADMAAKGIYEPLRVKEQVMNAATEAACMILRIDDVIAAKPKESRMPKPGAGGMTGGADMRTCMKLEILSIPLSIFLYGPNFACKKSPR